MMSLSDQTARRSMQRGFTMIEVLVAVLVLMVGILGVAAMQLISFQNNQGAYYRTQATYIASEILDRIRANDPASYSVYDGVDTTDSNTIPSSPGCATSLAGCTPANMAAQDIREWGAHFVDVFTVTDYRQTIPGSSATITRNGDTFTVVVTWAEEVFDNTDATDGSTERSIVNQTVSLTSIME